MSQPGQDPVDADYVNSVLGKAQLLLGAFGAGATHLRLTELSQRSGVTKASAHRLARELVHWGLLDRTDDGYQLGMRVFELGQRVPVSATLRAAARPVMADLFSATQAMVHLAVRSGHHVMFVEKVAGMHARAIATEVGLHFPMSCAASGKVLLAHAEDQEDILERMARDGMVRFTPHSTMSIEVLREQLAHVLDRRFAVERNEVTVGVKSFSVPVLDPSGQVVAAISATMPTSRKDDDCVLSQTQQAAGTISSLMRARQQVSRRPGSMAGVKLGRAG